MTLFELLSSIKNEEAFLKSAYFGMEISKSLMNDYIYLCTDESIETNSLEKKKILKGNFIKQTSYRYKFDKQDFMKRQEEIFRLIYYTYVNDFTVYSDKLYIDISKDPICVDIFYGDLRKHT